MEELDRLDGVLVVCFVSPEVLFDLLAIGRVVPRYGESV